MNRSFFSPQEQQGKQNQNTEIRLGLDTMRLLLEQMGNPQNGLKFVHIAGTNGKGSVLRFVSRILREAGYSVGAYSSPSVFREWEKISFDGRDIAGDEVQAGLLAVKEAEESVWGKEQKQGPGDIPLPHRPTAFERETALAFWYFARCNCDIVILEAGLGGDEDATNIIPPPLCAVITSVSFDHMGFLGNTLEEIAAHKAGIIKRGTGSVVTTPNQPREVLSVIRTHCEETETPLHMAKAALREVPGDYRLSMEAEYQQENAAIACEVILALREQGMKIEETAVRQGFLNTIWHGRFEKISENPPVYLDGAHNESAGRALAETVRKVLGEKKPVLIMGVMGDKAYDKLLESMLPLGCALYTVTPDNQRALPAQVLAARAEALAKEKLHCSIPIKPCASVEEAVHLALQEGIRQDCAVLCFGSLYYLGEARNCVYREIIGCI